MIFILVLVLATNLLLCYKSLKNVVSPPFLLGAGMLAAAIMAMTYYEEWQMDRMLPKTVAILGGGTFFFTLACLFWNKIYPSIPKFNLRKSSKKFNVKFLHSFYLGSIILGILGLLLKLYFLRSHFGSLSISELIIARRMDEWNGTNDFLLPSWVRQIGSYTQVLSIFTVWFLSIILIQKNAFLFKIKKVLYVQLVIVLLDGMLSGSKAPVLNLILLFGVFYMYNYYADRGDYIIKRKVWTRCLLILFLLSLSFRGLSLMIGRSVENTSNTDLLAEYCGAEVKNFDLFMHSPNKIKPQKWGESTFYSFYQEVDPTFKVSNGEFQSVKNFDLGNVYTMFRPYYEDFGLIGIFLMCFFIAAVSMFFYSKSQKSLKSSETINVYLLIYATMTLPLFMGFFSSKFTESVCRLGWIRSCIYVIILSIIFKRKIYAK